MSLAAGQVIGSRYRVLREIAEGGMGSVFEVERTEDGAHLALKVLLPELGTGDSTLERFRREAQLLSQIDHPGVVQMLDAGLMQDGSAFLVLELIRGETLLDFFKREAPVTAGRFVDTVVGIAEALDAVHAHGVIHRDLKPANIFVGEQGVKLVDFGIARATKLTRLTLTGQLVGTLRYMSPEQMLGRPHDHRADIYALGVITWAALAGRPPFLASGMAIVKEALQGTPRLDEAVPDLSADLCSVVHRALAMEPDGRHASAGAFATAFRAAAVGAPRRVSLPKRGFLPLTKPAEVKGGSKEDEPTVAPPARGGAPVARPPAAPSREAEAVLAAPAAPAAREGGGSRAVPFAILTLSVVGVALLAAAYFVTSHRTADDPEITATHEATHEPSDSESTGADAGGRMTRIVSVPAGARVELNGTVIGNTPLDVPHTATGTRELTVRLAGHVSVPVLLTRLTQREVTVELEEVAARAARTPAPRPAAASPPEEAVAPDDDPAASEVPREVRHGSEVCDPWSGENCD